MNSFMVEDGRVDVPSEVRDLASFRQWALTAEFPEGTHISYFGNGDIWIDMSKEQVFSHNQVKTSIGHCLWSIAEENFQGRFFSDGIRFTSIAADLSTNPDGIYASTETLKSSQLKLTPGADSGFVELEGTPDMALEVISRSSVQKDTDILLDKYWRAGIPEYWLVDARGEALKFEVYRHTADGYRKTESEGGWIRSEVFKRRFRLSCETNGLGHPRFVLDQST